MTILLAGATGLVGSRVLALRRDIVPVGRRATGVAGEIVADFAALPPLPSALVAVSALGTTIRAAGSQAAFRAVDPTTGAVSLRAVNHQAFNRASGSNIPASARRPPLRGVSQQARWASALSTVLTAAESRA